MATTYFRSTTPTTLGPQLVSTTLGFLTAARKIDIADKVWYVRGELSPFLHLAKAGYFRKRTVGDPKFQQFEQPEHAVTFKSTVTATGTTGTTLTVDSSAMLKVDDLITPLDASGQVCRVTAIGSATQINVVWYTSTGAYGGTTPAANVADDVYWLNLGNASKEGSLLPSILQPMLAARTNYTETMRYPFGGSRHRLKADTFAGRGMDNMARQEWFKAKRDVEHKLMFGVPFEHANGSNVYRSTGGLWYWITKQSGNVTSYAGTSFDVGKLMNDIELNFEYGSDTKILLANSRLIGILDKFKRTVLQMTPGDDVLGLRVNWIETNHGRLMVVHSKALSQPNSYGAGTLNGMGFIIDPEYIDYVVFDEDLHIEMNKERPDYDGTVNEFIGDVGIAVNVSQNHGVIHNIATVSYTTVT